MSLRSGKKYIPDDEPPMRQHGREKASAQQDELRSHASKSSRSSKMSAASSLALKTRAKAEATRVQLAFAEKEANVKRTIAEKQASMKRENAEREREMAEAEAELQILQCQREAAAAAAEAAAYLETYSSESEGTHEGPEMPEKPLSPAERASEYVQRVSSMPTTERSIKTEPAEVYRPKPAAVTSTPRQHYSASDVKPARKYPAEYPRDRIQSFPLPQPKDCVPEQQCIQDITKYLLRKEAVNSSFIKFDDSPENYWAWKSSFQNAIKDLNLSASETLDLMIKWLSTESAEHAKSMRRVHLFNPSAGFDMAWQRLEKKYGSPEVIQRTLQKRLDAFPKLTNKDAKKLEQLGDLLEIECAKEEGYLRGLTYLDNAIGLNPTVEKLPYHMQLKWASVGTKYKAETGDDFPQVCAATSTDEE
ncbi:uncharacterized protein LOC116410228 [Xenopus tropicalis]|uniref:Uncharacterized protein LOC116410228 n=1 Tax=Xenopus tropicalis TaxID=8364 RepID=A0A8J1JGT0_XENTR|nr:uncharacterized protein LOC116410228 [Xenopus tropicalis]